MLLKVQLTPTADGRDTGGWAIFDGVSDPVYTDRCVVPYDEFTEDRGTSPEDIKYWPGYSFISQYHYFVEGPVTREGRELQDGDTNVIVAVQWTDPEGNLHVLHASGQVFLMDNSGATIERL